MPQGEIETMPEYTICETGKKDYCLIDERGYRALAKREVSGIRCIRHGALLGATIVAPDRKTAREVLEKERIKAELKYWRAT
jgi:hypothetical protein